MLTASRASRLLSFASGGDDIREPEIAQACSR
jgi:hypothetical protein